MISVLGQLKGGIDKIFDWFKNMFLKEMLINHLITSSKTPVGIEVPNITVSEEKVKLLEIYINKRLSFDDHIAQLSERLGKNCIL